MVLSNKKLKQKLRAAKAELIVTSEAYNNLTYKNSVNSRDLDLKTLQSLRTILNPEAQKPKLSKREKRRQKAQKENSEIIKVVDVSGDAEGKKHYGSKSDAVEVKKKKKRKRDESESSENVKEKKPQQLKKKKKPKKKVGNGKVKEEVAEQKGDGATGEQLVAKTDESLDRKYVEISSKIYVGGIPYYSTEDDIRSYFEGCGTITSVDCMTFADTGKFRGIAIITFKTEAAAKRALALDGSDMGGLFLKIQSYKSARVNKLPDFSPSAVEGYNRIYVGNLSWDITENDLRKLFTNCTITSIRFGKDNETGEFKGYAHVDFADSLSLKMALKLDQNIVCGRPVRISCAVTKKGTMTKSRSTSKDNQAASVTVSEGDENKVDSSELNAVSSKIRRRTCYECGERGHLSSSCPKKQAADTKLDSMPKDNQVETQDAGAKIESVGKDNQVGSGNVSGAGENQVNSSEVNAVSSKIKRRKCYECGERGHLSSSCPKKQTTDSTNPGATSFMGDLLII